MNLGANVLSALIALRINVLRSALTMLGIIIGVAAVIAMVAVSAGAKQQMQSQIDNMGSNIVAVFSEWTRARGKTRIRLVEEDVNYLLRNVPQIRLAAPAYFTDLPAVNGNKNMQVRVFGTTPDAFEVRDWDLSEGSAFTTTDNRSKAKVAVIGSEIANELFAGTSALGQTLRVNRVPFEVIGVLTPMGLDASGNNLDEVVAMPIASVKQNLVAGHMRRFANRVRMILLEVYPDTDMGQLSDDIRQVLRDKHRVPPRNEDTLRITEPSALVSARNEAEQTMRTLLAAVASISLVVGGIGIMNIMLVSVTERTREIGLRMAVGARPQDIQSQFMVEAVTLCVIGGAMGTALGAAAAYAISTLGGWPALVQPEAVLLAISVSCLIGIFFGFYPARKASRLSPIEALRFE